MTDEVALVWDEEALRRSVFDSGGDEAFVVELTATFATDLEASLAALDACLRCGDASRARRIAHRIKGGAAAIRAASLRNAAEALERAHDLDDIERRAEHVTAQAARTLSALSPTWPDK